MILWRLIVTLHVLIIIANGISMLVIPFLLPFPITIPLSLVLWTLFVRFSFLSETCPMTAIENHIRPKVGLPRIDGFISHYGRLIIKKLDLVGLLKWLKDVIIG